MNGGVIERGVGLFVSGLEIHSLVFRANHSFFVSERAIHSRKRANCSRRSFVIL